MSSSRIIIGKSRLWRSEFREPGVDQWKAEPGGHVIISAYMTCSPLPSCLQSSDLHTVHLRLQIYVFLLWRYLQSTNWVRSWRFRDTGSFWETFALLVPSGGRLGQQASYRLTSLDFSPFWYLFVLYFVEEEWGCFECLGPPLLNVLRLILALW